MGKFALGDEGTYVGGQGMDTLTRELADIGEQVFPKMLLCLNGSTNGIKGKSGYLAVIVPLSMRDWRILLSSP